MNHPQLSEPHRGAGTPLLADASAGITGPPGGFERFLGRLCRVNSSTLLSVSASTLDVAAFYWPR